MHELGQQDSLADTGATEQAGFPASNERKQQIHDLDARFEDAARRSRLMKGRRFRQNVTELRRAEWGASIQGFAEDVQDAPEAGPRHGDADRKPRVKHW